MSENNNSQNFADRLKNIKINRASVIGIAALTVAIGVIVSATVISNKSKNKPPIPQDTDKPSVSDTDRPLDTEEDTAHTDDTKDTEAETSKKPVSKPVENKVPSLLLPVSGALTSKHDPTTQVYSDTLGDWRVHLGIDISATEGASVYSAADGKVERVWKDDMMGYSIAIKHSGDCYTFYQNLSETLPEGLVEGASVRAGQLIGTIGDSAMVEIAEEPHLHFEMTVADLLVDPLEYFSEDALRSLSIDASYE
jgi:murein DD-endopeptidase MepM/ murein hydrolase activator NlpD